jgi:hypothetical protein
LIAATDTSNGSAMFASMDWEEVSRWYIKKTKYNIGFVALILVEYSTLFSLNPSA